MTDEQYMTVSQDCCTVCLKCDSIQLGVTGDLFYMFHLNPVVRIFALEIGIVLLVDLTIIVLAWP